MQGRRGQSMDLRSVLVGSIRNISILGSRIPYPNAYRFTRWTAVLPVFFSQETYACKEKSQGLEERLKLQILNTDRAATSITNEIGSPDLN